MRFIVVFALLVLARPSDACVLPNPEITPHDLDPAQAGDTVPPPAPQATYTIARGEIGGGCGAKTDCDGKYASISLDVQATDDATPADRLGYLITIVGGGDPPNGLYGRGFQGAGVVVQPRGNFEWSFDYDDKDFAFDVEIRVVDLNGNMSTPTVLHIAAEDSGGCMSASSTHSEWMLLPVVAFLLRPRRRR